MDLNLLKMLKVIKVIKVLIYRIGTRIATGAG